jgi:drug/metabolite transporter (DMT)-like permease
MWVLYAGLATLAFVVWALVSKYGLGYYQYLGFVSIAQVVAAVLLVVGALLKGGSFTSGFSSLSVLSGVFLALVYCFLNKSIQMASNPGLPVAVYRTQSLLTAIVAYLFLGAGLTWVTTFSMLLVAAGAFLLIDQAHKGDASREEEQVGKAREGLIGEATSSWKVLAVLAALACTGMDVSSKVAMRTASPIVHTVVQAVVGALVLLGIQFWQTGTFRLLYSKKNVDGIDKSFLVPVTGVVLAALLVLINMSMMQAPNPGYTKSILATGVVLITLISDYLFKGAKLRGEQWLGVGLITLGGIGIGEG